MICKLTTATCCTLFNDLVPLSCLEGNDQLFLCTMAAGSQRRKRPRFAYRRNRLSNKNLQMQYSFLFLWPIVNDTRRHRFDKLYRSRFFSPSAFYPLFSSTLNSIVEFFIWPATRNVINAISINSWEICKVNFDMDQRDGLTILQKIRRKCSAGAENFFLLLCPNFIQTHFYLSESEKYF